MSEETKVDYKQKAEEAFETSKKVVKEAYVKTADTVEKVLEDERVQDFSKKTVDVLEKTSTKVISGAKTGGKFVLEKSEEFINDPRVEQTVENVKDKSLELKDKLSASVKDLFSKVKK